MPATIAGAIGVLWSNVLVNSSTGLGALWSPIMALEPVNAVFNAINFCTISCISIGIVMLVAQEIGEANGETGAFPAVLGFMAWAVVTPTTTYVYEAAGEITSATTLPAGIEAITSVGGFNSGYLGATGLFTALIVGILALELYNVFRKNDSLKIKMPDQVPPGVARAFEVLVPTFLTLLVVGLVGWGVQMLTGLYVNDVISKYIQTPLQNIIGNNIIAVMVLYVIISAFWLVGIHGNNMVSAVKEPIFKPLLYANMTAFQEGARGTEIPYVLNMTMMQMFAEWGGSGVTLGLVFAIFMFGKREDNKAIAALSIVPGLFNINETVTFGIPLVLNPILGIPFILAPVACIFVGWLLVTIGFCPRIVIEVPWTMPPLFLGFLATGGNIMGAVSQIIVIVVSTVIYSPFLIAYEKYQNKQAAAAE